MEVRPCDETPRAIEQSEAQRSFDNEPYFTWSDTHRGSCGIRRPWATWTVASGSWGRWAL